MATGFGADTSNIHADTRTVSIETVDVRIGFFFLSL